MSEPQPYPPAQPSPTPYPPQPQYAPQPAYSQPYPQAQPPQQRPYVPAPELRRDVDAALAARRELGAEYEDHVAAGLAERVEQLAAMRTAELRHASEGSVGQRTQEATNRQQRFVLGIISLGAGIPITAISAVQVDPGLLGILVSWAGIVGVNVAVAWHDRKR